MAEAEIDSDSSLKSPKSKKKPEYERFGALIKMLMRSKGLEKTRDLANKTDISRQTLARYISGTRFPDSLSLYRLARALDTTMEEMVKAFDNLSDHPDNGSLSFLDSHREGNIENEAGHVQVQMDNPESNWTIALNFLKPEIKKRAHQIFLDRERGGWLGDSSTDWKQAEREFYSRVKDHAYYLSLQKKSLNTEKKT